MFISAQLLITFVFYFAAYIAVNCVTHIFFICEAFAHVFVCLSSPTRRWYILTPVTRPRIKYVADTFRSPQGDTVSLLKMNTRKSKAL